MTRKELIEKEHQLEKLDFALAVSLTIVNNFKSNQVRTKIR